MDEEQHYPLIGIDEAGRCPVIGPLIQVGVRCTCRNDAKRLHDLGVTDSKKLTPEKRRKLADAITAEFEWKNVEWSPGQIDRRVKRHELNLMEADGIILLSSLLRARYIVMHRIQKSGLNEALIQHIFEAIPVPLEIVEHEDFHPAVAAASILATDLRTRAMVSIRKRYSDIGNGEPSSRITRNFIRVHLRNLPDVVRNEWATVKRMQNKRVEKGARI